MFLKEIEMQGFKSFADKTKVVFDQGVTAVVGPNGSGKSNITESLRWALGESSAKSLRGGKMPDVIFAGTEKRKPLNYAQVAVTLDNRDGFIANAGEEIRVERHIYRHGESDYLIDGKKVRLKDIHHLFMDTGLGRDSFSIISQGRVEAIFNSKPEERRAIFEEAAGVLKYKTRKKETESKLQQTQDNLDRLEDIIYELDNQLKPLEKQAETAKCFLQLDSERQTLHLALLVEDIQDYKQRLAHEQERLAVTQSSLSASYEKRQDLEEANQALKAKRHQLSETLENQQEQLLRLTSLISDYERRIEIIQLESDQEAEKKATAEEQLATLSALQTDVTEQLAQKEAKSNQLQAKHVALKHDIKALEMELERFSVSPDQLMEKIRDDFLALMQKEASLSNRLTAIEAECSKQEEQVAQRHQELAQVLQALTDQGQVVEEAEGQYQECQTRVADLLMTYQTKVKAFDELKADYQVAQNALFEHLDDIKAREARKNSLEAIQRNHSQFYAGVKAVLQQKSQLSGIIGAVSEHLTFDRTYQTALEIALGGSSQHIIVADERAAKSAIAFLKNNRQGRATFLPLTTIKPRQLSSTQQSILSTCSGFLGMANQLVTFDASLSHIFDNLLGVTAIFDTVDHASQAAKQLHYQVRLVTLDGTELRPGGAFAGGASRQNNTVFVKPELDALHQELTELRQQLQGKEEAISRLKVTLIDLEDQLEHLKEEGERARLDEQKASLEHEQALQVLQTLESQRQALSAYQIAAHHDALTSEKEAVTNQLHDLTQQKDKLSQEMTALRDNKEMVISKTTDLQTQLAEKKLLEREVVSEIRFVQADYQRLQDELAKNDESLSRIKLLLEDSAKFLSKEQLPQLLADYEEATERRTVDLGRIDVLKEDLALCNRELDDLSQQLMAITQANERLIRDQAHLESHIEQLSDKLSGFAKTLSEEYQLTLTDALAKAIPLEDSSLARQTLSDLKRHIKALGPVNLEAIEQYEEVSERLVFLVGQKEDLDKAKSLLLGTIHDMDEEVKGRFKTTFEAIRESFKQTFTQMFGGGTSDLRLTDGDWLTAGVEISVQPPGKKIQSLNLMSGGEKALSALALLFAIIRVKTIPFVILDEVEAALDEANVKRFGDYLNRFDKSSQFIVVTHRKGTMSAADSIYGVTMQESGVSKIVSVKLKEAKKLLT